LEDNESRQAEEPLEEEVEKEKEKKKSVEAQYTKYNIDLS
jgi:hypothetical protein